jgi:hypothetical protein
VTDPAARWTDELLDAMRDVGDPPADALIAALVDAGRLGEVSAVLRDLVDNDDLPPDLPPEVVAYLATSRELP